MNQADIIPPTASAVATTKLKGNHAARKLSLMIGADVLGCGPT